MTDLIRLVYASRSTFTPTANQQGLNPDVARILAKSRKNNARLQLVGGLLFGNGHFLQCLEGDAKVVEGLYSRIEADKRHRDVKLLARHRIANRSFGTWSMKYVPGELALAALLRRWGMASFDPYRLSPEQIDAAVQYMLQGDDTVVDTQPGELEKSASKSSTRRPRESIVGVLSPTPAVRATAPAGSSLPWVMRWLAWGLVASTALGIGFLLTR